MIVIAEHGKDAEWCAQILEFGSRLLGRNKLAATISFSSVRAPSDKITEKNDQVRIFGVCSLNDCSQLIQSDMRRPDMKVGDRGNL